MVRVLVLTNMYPPHHYGGLELSCADVVDGLRARGHDVEVLTSTVRVADVESVRDDTVDIHRELGIYWDDHELLSPPVWQRLAVERSNQDALRRALAAFKPDVVSVWGMGAMSLGLLGTVTSADVPAVYCVCDDWLDYGVNLDAWSRLFVRRPRLGRVVRRLTGVPTHLPDLASCGTFCWVSQRTYHHAERQTGRRYPRSTVVYSGVDLGTFSPPPRTTLRPWRWNLTYVGRLDRRKGTDVAVRALAALPPDASLTIVGRGDPDERAHLEQIADRCHVSDQVTFRVEDRTGLVGVYRETDAVLFTSRWDEPFGLVPLEAMACGTPVVATGRGGSAEFLADGRNCLLYPAEDSEALAAAIRRLADDEQLRRDLVTAGLRTARELSVEALVDSMERWHVAAARGYVDGEPEHRPSPLHGGTS